MDEDLDTRSADELREEVRRLRAGIREHRDSSGQELCWHHPALWGLLPEKTDPAILVPEWPQFMRGCVRYRQSLDEQQPDAPRTNIEFGAGERVEMCAWRSTLGGAPGLELAQVGARVANGTLLAFTEDDGAFEVSYAFAWDDAWVIAEARVSCRAVGALRERRWARSSEGVWTCDGAIVPALAGCTDVDLWPTPFTNTLAIRRLGLAQGERREIRVAYVEAPALTIRAQTQVYTRVGAQRYRFESPSSGFVADIDVDERGLVVRYPELFTRQG